MRIEGKERDDQERYRDTEIEREETINQNTKVRSQEAETETLKHLKSKP